MVKLPQAYLTQKVITNIYIVTALYTGAVQHIHAYKQNNAQVGTRLNMSLTQASPCCNTVLHIWSCR